MPQNNVFFLRYFEWIEILIVFSRRYADRDKHLLSSSLAFGEPEMHKFTLAFLIAYISLCHAIEPTRYPCIYGIDNTGNMTLIDTAEFVSSNIEFVYQLADYRALLYRNIPFEFECQLGLVIDSKGTVDSVYDLDTAQHDNTLPNALKSSIRLWRFDPLNIRFKKILLQYAFRQDKKMIDAKIAETGIPQKRDGHDNLPKFTCEKSIEIALQDAEEDISVRRYGFGGFMSGFILGPVGIGLTAIWASNPAEPRVDRTKLDKRLHVSCYENTFVPELTNKRRKRAFSRAVLGMGTLPASVALGLITALLVSTNR